jgi:LytTr DNA-binding domain
MQQMHPISGPDVTPKYRFYAQMKAAIDPRQSWTSYLIAAGVTLAVSIALLEPSASGDLGLGQRMVFWFAHVGAALVILESVQLLLGRIRITRQFAPLAIVILAGVIGAMIFSVFSILLLEGLLAAPDPKAAVEDLTLAAFLTELRNSAGQTVLFWVLLNGPRLIMMAQDQEDGTAEMLPVQAAGLVPESAKPAHDPALVEFAARLPRRLGTDIVALTAELHYLRVYTRQGDALILMSFGRAIEALQVVAGMAVHRSHWVALSHVVGLEIEGDRAFCRLDTGLTVPVSRSNRARLRQTLAERDQRRAEGTAGALVEPAVRRA